MASVSRRLHSSLVWQFMALGIPAMLVAFGLLVYAFDRVSLRNLQGSTETTARVVGQLFENRIYPAIGGFVRDAEALSPDEIRAHPAQRILGEEVAALTRETPVVRVNVFSPAGTLLFSTRKEGVGVPHGDDHEVREALAGRETSEFRELSDGRVLLGTYRPVRVGGAVVAVIEHYSDVTAMFRSRLMSPATVVAVILIGAILAALFLFLLWMIGRAEGRRDRERRQKLDLERGIERANAANQAKTEFLANMSHELRTPLNAIIGFSEMIGSEQMGPIGSPRYREYAQDIHVSGKHLLHVINEILDISKVESGTMVTRLQETDMAELVGKMLHLVRNGGAAEGVSLSMTGRASLPTVVTDDGKVRQILLNVLSNAVKFTPAGGEVLVDLALADDGKWLDVVVRDTGIGIRAEDIPVALSPFGQIDGTLARRQAGTGLGLPLSARLAELLGGRLTLESTPGVGTTVSVRLPANRPANGLGNGNGSRNAA